jgi:predicted dehydrogenase
MSQIQISWLDPHKERRLTIVGTRKMLVFDDVQSVEKIRIYDKGVDRKIRPGFNSYADYLTLRNGDVFIPYIAMDEPLGIECQHFLDCIKKKEMPLTDGRSGLEVVRILEKAQESLHNKGVPVYFLNHET